MSIFLSSGEASGDHYTAKIAQALRAQGYAGDLWGMGALASREAGIRCEWAGERLQLLGLTEVFSAIPGILKLLGEVVERILRERPECVIVADSPDYHMRLIKKLRKKGYQGKIFYISPPSVWAWRSGRADDLRAYVDECLPLFEFEHRFLEQKGCRSYWIGYPLLEEFERGALPELPEELKNDEKIVAFLPGSRRSEVQRLLPIMEQTALDVAEKGWHPVFSIAPGLHPEVRAEMQARFLQKGFRFYGGSGRDLMRAARCAVAASGTITVEALLVDCYMIVTYKLNVLSGLVGRMVIKTKYYAMANILYGGQIFPELLQEYATRKNVTRCVFEWLDAPAASQAAVREKMAAAKRKLGSPRVYEYWAERVLEATKHA